MRTNQFACKIYLSFEGIDKRSSDEFPLLLRISDALEARVEFLRRIDNGEVDTKVLLLSGKNWSLS